MRQFASSLIVLLIFFDAFFCLLKVENRHVREEELIYAVDTSMRHSLKNAGTDINYPVNEDEELYADFLAELLTQISAESELVINIYEIDAKEGILDLEVTEYYSEINGDTDSVSCRRNAKVIVI